MTPIFLARSSYGAYFLFGGLTILTVIVLFIFMQETRGLSLESIQEGFQASSTSQRRLVRIRRLINGKSTQAQTSPEGQIEIPLQTLSGENDATRDSSSLIQRIEIASA
jgi:hypothetical protein